MRLMTQIPAQQGTTRKYGAGLELGQQDALAASLSRKNDLLINATEDGPAFLSRPPSVVIQLSYLGPGA